MPESHARLSLPGNRQGGKGAVMAALLDDRVVSINENGEIATKQDPPAITLPTAVLDQYVGAHKMAEGFVYRIARDGDHLTGAMNGGEPAVLQAELPDVLFTPGQSGVRRIFQRDTADKITGFLSRREGRDMVLTRQGV